MAEFLTEFEVDESRQLPFVECMKDYDVAEDPGAEWPNNIISRQTIVYGSGRIARRGEAVQHRVDPEELNLCQRLANEAAALMQGVEVGMGSGSSDPFFPFFVAANVGDPVPPTITPALVRERFAGTIFPPAEIVVEPLEASGAWWEAVQYDGSEEEDPDAYLAPWKRMIDWFQAQDTFVSRVFVGIGTDAQLQEIPETDYPSGTVITGCVLPRLALGLTSAGSLVGLMGYAVYA